MALRGTLKDFGIADIFQLIGHQTKTGRLLLKNRDSEVRVSFREGNVVKVESQTRSRKELLGHMLVRAEVVSEGQLDEALENQRRSLRRLGDILVQNGWVKRETLNEFTRLQATETIYRLFSWQNGTYEFEQADTELDSDFGDPMRAESVLMEGFRMVDEWPMIRKKITGYAMCFSIEKVLPPPQAEDDGFDDAFGEMGDAPKKEKVGDPDIGNSERKIYELVRPDRDVQKLVDLARIGEFETCKALSVLLSKGYITALEPKKEASSEPLIKGALVTDRDFAPTLLWSLVALGTVVGVVVIAFVAGTSGALSRVSTRVSAPSALSAALVQAQRARLVDAIETARVEQGGYPESLDALVSSGIVDASDLVYPTGRPFAYAKRGDSFELAPSLP